MRLPDLNPRWGIDADGRHGMGVTFDCPCCRERRLAAWFANPIDGLPPTGNATLLWQRSGDTFETLTLTPSIDCSKHGHWHGHVTAGEIRP